MNSAKSNNRRNGLIKGALLTFVGILLVAVHGYASTQIEMPPFATRLLAGIGLLLVLSGVIYCFRSLFVK